MYKKIPQIYSFRMNNRITKNTADTGQSYYLATRSLTVSFLPDHFPDFTDSI